MEICDSNKKPLYSEPKALTLVEFSSQALKWYEQYTQSSYFVTYVKLEQRLSQKAMDKGYLEVVDLADIADWGGNQRGIKQRVQRGNSGDQVKQATTEAIRKLDSPSNALRAVLSINQWGLTYASKTLRFVCPRDYPALDQKLRKAINKTLLPTIYDGNINSMVRGYLRFLELCRKIKHQVSVPGPRSAGEWFIADIEMAVFQFVWDGGRLM